MKVWQTRVMRHCATALLCLDFCVAFCAFTLIASKLTLFVESCCVRKFLVLFSLAAYVPFYLRRIIVVNYAIMNMGEGCRRNLLSWHVMRFLIIDAGYAVFQFAVIAALYISIRAGKAVVAGIWCEVLLVVHLVIHIYMTYISLRFDMQSSTFFPKIKGSGRNERGAHSKEILSREDRKSAWVKFLKVYLIEAVCLLTFGVIAWLTHRPVDKREEDSFVKKENIHTDEHTLSHTQWNVRQCVADRKYTEFSRIHNGSATETSQTQDSNERLAALRVRPNRIAEANAQLASEKNQVMDELLNQPQIPSDYAETMIKLYRDRKQDVLTRDFAVQHIGLYAQALNRRGEYVAASAKSQKLRSALFDAAGETRTIVAAAAFRALSDMSAFDSRIDAGRLDSLLARCAADLSVAPAARAMAVQLCGERRVNESRAVLVKIISNKSNSEILRRSAKRAILSIDGKKFTQ